MYMNYNQLIILTTRPVFFAAIKKVVAQRVFSELGSSDGHLHETHTRSCTEAARHNLELARILQSTNRKWLQPGLHFLFNAAVVLLLGRIGSACQNNADTDADTYADGSYAADIQFAIHVFEQEAETGTNYPRDCCRVLQDLKAVTDRFILIPASLGVHSHGSTEYPAPYQEMMTWAQTDSLQLRNTLLV